MAIEAMSRGIINKIMHTPITTLKTAARQREATTVVDLIRRIFNLSDGRETRAAAASDSKSDQGAHS